LLFGETHLLQNYYSQFTNRRQKFGEDIASLGSDLERLSQLAYPECSQIIRDKIACAQFASALSDRFVSRTLQLEGITSLQEAIVRAKTIKLIQESNFEQRRKNINFEGRRKNRNNDNFSGNFNQEARDRKKSFESNSKENEEKFKTNKFGESENNGRKRIENGKECWDCRKKGHFRSESGQVGKQGVVELCGVSSAGTEKSQQHVYFVNNCSCNVIDDVCYCDVHIINQSSFRNNKTENNLKDFYFAGQLDNKSCSFKIDTSSDISIVTEI